MLSATAKELRSQITSLQAALEGAREEIAARKAHEATLTSQLQANTASCDANIRQLQDKCEHLEAQATTYKLDFEQERSDRVEMAGRLEGERETFQANIVKLEGKLKAMQLEHDNTSLAQRKEEVLPQSPLPPSLGKEVRSIKLPDMPMTTVSTGAVIHNSKVYISIMFSNESTCPVLVYSTNEHKWNTLEAPLQSNLSAIAVVDNHITLIGGGDEEAEEVTNTLSTWYEEEGQWKQVLPPMPTRRVWPAIISHANLLLVTGGIAADDSTVLNTTDVLDLTTMKWTTPEGLDLPVPLWIHHLALCGEYLYLVGGFKVLHIKSSEDPNSQAWRVKWSDVKQTVAPQHSQPQRGVWTQIADPPTLCPTVASCGGTLYTVGGMIDEKPNSTVYTYNTARNQWASVGDMCVGRAGHCAVPLSSTSMFVAGGAVLNEGKDSPSSSTELILL